MKVKGLEPSRRRVCKDGGGGLIQRRVVWDGGAVGVMIVML